MFRFLEGKYQPLAPLRVFYSRLAQASCSPSASSASRWSWARSATTTSAAWPWLDALLNASMILTGMGPADQMRDREGKMFAVFYCLYSGIAFLSLVAILMAPIYHRFLHRFNLDEEGKPYLPPRADPPPMTTDM